MNNIKPCPYCGNNELEIFRKGTPNNKFWAVECYPCAASVGMADTKEEAIELWNTRVTPTIKLPEKNCENCVWWRRLIGECDHWQYGEGVKPSGNDFLIHVDVLDDSGLSVSVLTGPKFGCVLFEKRGESN